MADGRATAHVSAIDTLTALSIHLELGADPTRFPEPVIHDLVEDSYDLIVSALPRARRRALLWQGDGAG